MIFKILFEMTELFTSVICCFAKSFVHKKSCSNLCHLYLQAFFAALSSNWLCLQLLQYRSFFYSKLREWSQIIHLWRNHNTNSSIPNAMLLYYKQRWIYLCGFTSQTVLLHFTALFHQSHKTGKCLGLTTHQQSH